MNEHEDSQVTPDLGFWDTHRFMLLIALSITISLILVSISMTLYATSGAAQLDLSRPGYKAVSNQTLTKDPGFENYPTSGSLDASSLNGFKKLYDAQAVKAKAVDAFSGDPLNPESLEISAPEN